MTLAEDKRPKLTLGRVAVVGVLGIIALVIVAITGGWIYRASLVHDTEASRPQIDTAQGVDELFVMNVGGIPQYFHARGHDRDAPVLFYLHGGPLTPMMPFSHLFQNEWERDFIVVHWDQRSAGKTRGASDPNVQDMSNTNAQMYADTIEASRLVAERFKKKKIGILGHSWGTMIGHHSVQTNPELYWAYIGVGVVVDMIDNERYGYEKTIEIARERNDAEALKVLADIAPYPGADESIDIQHTEALREVQFRYGVGISHKSPDTIERDMILGMLSSPEYGLNDIYSVIDAPAEVIARLMTPSRDARSYFDARSYGDFQVPVVYLLGRWDYQTSSELAAEYLDTVDAPSKKIIWFEESAHAPMIDEPDAFAAALREHVLPLVQKESAQAN